MDAIVAVVALLLDVLLNTTSPPTPATPPRTPTAEGDPP